MCDSVVPINFKVIREDEADEPRADLTPTAQESAQNAANFTLQYSYPAVEFLQVSFSVNRSQQQANFLQECLCRLKACLPFQSGAARALNQVEILKSVNLSVPCGSIFGLLGPSSCGKTTLLRCLVGLLQPTSGHVRLFCQSSQPAERAGARTGCTCGCLPVHGGQKRPAATRSEGCKIPGSNVGYMPQDLGLYEDFTIRELLGMFGRYMRMGGALVEARIRFMTEFLDLPDADRVIGSLSGGQKRRVSFAVACLHMPPLIILDEPTVGVDPLLRKSIWRYLRKLASEEKKTIIITTHYIEEAAQADQVALMRAGEILVQDSPKRIMQNHGCTTLEEAFLKICNNVQEQQQQQNDKQRYKLYPQQKFHWQDLGTNEQMQREKGDAKSDEARLKVASESNALHDESELTTGFKHSYLAENIDKLSMTPNTIYNSLANSEIESSHKKPETHIISAPNNAACAAKEVSLKRRLKEHKSSASNLKNILNEDLFGKLNTSGETNVIAAPAVTKAGLHNKLAVISQPVGAPARTGISKRALIDGWSPLKKATSDHQSNLSLYKALHKRIEKSLSILWALIYKNYKRNLNSIPLVAFQFLLPLVQMISFSLCVGGKPTNIGLGVVNFDRLPPVLNGTSALLVASATGNGLANSSVSLLLQPSADLDYGPLAEEDLLSNRYLEQLDTSILRLRHYPNIELALADVRSTKLWAALEISENFTASLRRRFDLDNFYQLDSSTIQQSVLRLYPDRSNKVLDMICHRSLVMSYRTFLLDNFEHFKKLPVEVKEPIFSIKPNLISNSIDGYTESIAAGLLASLTYIMAAGLTTFIMVVERSEGILERTFTCGINPVTYLIAHAIFRSLVMMFQVALVMFLTFYLLQQPILGSIWLAYIMLMTLNLTGISYGLLISSIVGDQNGAALTIVSSLVVKITLSGILWPFEAIPKWLRTICYVQPLTMPVQALKAITLKGSGLGDLSVQLGFLVSISWLLVFLTISAKRFKFYQH